MYTCTKLWNTENFMTLEHLKLSIYFRNVCGKNIRVGR